MQFLGDLEAGSERLDVTFCKGCFRNVKMLAQDALIERALYCAPVFAREFLLRSILFFEQVQEAVQIAHGLIISGPEIQLDATGGNADGSV